MPSPIALAAFTVVTSLAAQSNSGTPTPWGTSSPEAAPADTAPAAEKAAAGSDDGEKLIAVLDLKAEGETGALANALATVMATDITARAGYKAVSRNELKALLSQQADANLLGCDSANCASDVAKLVDAKLVVTGTLGAVAVGGAGADGTQPLVLTLSLIDPAGPAVVQRVDATWRGAPEEMVDLVQPLLDRLLDGAAAATYTGGLELFAPAGASIVLDGKELGTAPLKAPVRDLAIGVHVVQVTAGGYVPARKDVIVSRNETAVVRLVLEEEPYYTQWWFWTAVGGGAAVAIAGGTAVALAFAGEDPPPPTRVVVKAPLPSTSATTVP